mgnify:CR=1 FL=1
MPGVADAPTSATDCGVKNVSMNSMFGFAVESPGDIVRATWIDNPNVIISRIDGDGGFLPRESDKNTAGVAAKQLLSSLKIERGVEIELQKKSTTDFPYETVLGTDLVLTLLLFSRSRSAVWQILTSLHCEGKMSLKYSRYSSRFVHVFIMKLVLKSKNSL